MDALATDLTEVFDLIISLPDRLFDGDLDLYCSAVGIDDRRAALIRRLRSAKPVRSGRADLYYGGSSFKLLEFNIGSQFGCADVVEVLRALMAVGPFVEFAEEFGLSYVDVMAEITTMLRPGLIGFSDAETLRSCPTTKITCGLCVGVPRRDATKLLLDQGLSRSS